MPAWLTTLMQSLNFSDSSSPAGGFFQSIKGIFASFMSGLGVGKSDSDGMIDSLIGQITNGGEEEAPVEEDSDGNENTNTVEEQAIAKLYAVAAKLPEELKAKVDGIVAEIREGKLDLTSQFETTSAGNAPQLGDDASKLARAVESAFAGGNDQVAAGEIVKLASQAATMETPSV